MFLPHDCDNDTLTPATCNGQLAEGTLACDHWHHFYHYQSSSQYLWLAETLRMLGRDEDAQKAYERALFQDHFNEEALQGMTREAKTPAYDKHPLTDIAFCASIGELPTSATRYHDEASHAYLGGDFDKAFACLASATASEPLHSNSYFLRGRCRFALGEYENARADFTEAIRLSHLRHDAYHRFASGEHLARGRKFLEAGGIDIAINHFTKALDLYRHNKEALRARATAYRMKGNAALARADEERV